MSIKSTTGLANERLFYTGMALAMIVLVLIGFAASFYFRGVINYPRPNPSITPFIMLHGIAFSLWMLLFASQAGLVAANKRDLHRKLGIIGFCFAALLVPLMYLTAVGQVARNNAPPFTDPLGWTAITFLPIPGFVALIWLGWKKRHDPGSHKRLMLGASLFMMDPAIGRLPIVPPTVEGFAQLNVLMGLTFVPLLAHDLFRLGRIHWASAFGAILFAITLASRLVLMTSPEWAKFAIHFPGVGASF